MAKIDYFKKPAFANNYLGSFIGIRLSDIDFKQKYDKMPIEGHSGLVKTICSNRSGLVYTPYGKNLMLAQGEREWTYLIGIKPVYEFQEVNEKGNIRAVSGGEGRIETARFNERPHFNHVNDARMFIAKKIVKFSTEPEDNLAKKVGCFIVNTLPVVAAMPEVRGEVARELAEASANEPTGLRLKALIRGAIDYVQIKRLYDKAWQVHQLLVMGFTDEELRFYGYSDEDVQNGHEYNPHNDREEE